jgi:hypothetical protein
MSGSTKINKIDAKLNRLKSKRAMLERQTEVQSKQMRMGRTRTLIQMGGLLSLVNMHQWFDIELGDDLQTDLNKRDQSMMLLGLLETVTEQMPKQFSDERKLELKLKGLRFLEKHQNVKFEK